MKTYFIDINTPFNGKAMINLLHIVSIEKEDETRTILSLYTGKSISVNEAFDSFVKRVIDGTKELT